MSSNNEINIQKAEKETVSKSVNKKSYSQPIKKKRARKFWKTNSMHGLFFIY